MTPVDSDPPELELPSLPLEDTSPLEDEAPLDVDASGVAVELPVLPVLEPGSVLELVPSIAEPAVESSPVVLVVEPAVSVPLVETSSPQAVATKKESARSVCFLQYTPRQCHDASAENIGNAVR